MANITDPFAQQVHGTNPQYLIEKITRNKIYNCQYWKEECFGLTASTILEKACALKYVGGTYGGILKPSKFLCLLLKLLQLQPEKDIIYTFIENEDFKYVRLLGAFYLRMTGKAEEIYSYLEPLYEDYRKFAFRTVTGWEVRHVDDFIDSLLREELVCDIALPHMIKRLKLEDLGSLPPRTSALEGELEELERLEKLAFGIGPDHISDSNHEGSSGEDEPQQIETKSAPGATTTAVSFNDDESEIKLEIGGEATMNPAEAALNPLQRDDRSKRENFDEKNSQKDRTGRHDVDGDQRDSSRNRRRSYRSQSSDYSSSESDRERSRDRRSRRYDSRDRDRGRDRDRRNHRRRDSREKDWDRKRSRRDSRSPSRSRSSSRSRSAHYHRDSRRDRHGDDRHKRNRRDESRDKERDIKDRYSKNERDRSRDRGRDKDMEREHRKYSDDHKVVQSSEAAATAITDKQKKNEKIFDKMFGKKKASSAGGGGSASSATGPPGKTGGKVMYNQKGEKVVITASEGTVEYWNQIRECLGMSKLKE